MKALRKACECLSLKWVLVVSVEFNCSAKAIEADPPAVIYQLYRDFGWMALFALEGKVARYLGGPIAKQSRSVLKKYFDPELTQLLLNEARCKAQRKGELCSLDFDPIFASQDPGATNLFIIAADPGTVLVRFTYPSNGEKIQLKYQVKKHDLGWRIDDIIYLSNDNVSLKVILKRSAAR